jgi:dihydroorotase
MKKILIRKATIVEPGSRLNGKQNDILVDSGIIWTIGEELESGDAEIIEAEGSFLSPGWLDLRANFWDPGHEYREGMESGIEAAAYGGFTGVALLPETEPRLSSKTGIEYVRNRAAGKAVNLYPLASISREKEGNDLSEMYDLAEAGASGFSSGYRPVSDHGFLTRALLYAGKLNKPFMLLPENRSLTGKGQINEGVISVQLGLSGSPALAEETEISSLISIAEYTGTPVHFSCISTRKGMELVIKAFENGLPVSASVSIHHLYFNEEDLLEFNTNLKLRPPLRTAEDQRFLQDALRKHRFVTVVSDHTPYEEDKKKCEFELAAYGTSGIQTCFSQLIRIYGSNQIDLIVDLLAVRTREIMGIAPVAITEGAAADLTLFDPEAVWMLNEKTNRSRSKESPLWNEEMQGKAVAILNGGILKRLN